jgi:hypothetical protein
MKKLLTVTAAIAVLGLGFPATMQAQTPLPKLPPQPKLRWLGSVTISPASVRAGNDATGKVTLLRPAIEDMTIAISIPGGTPIDGGFWVLGGILVGGNATIPAGSDRGTFWIKSSATAGARTITIVASYATETKSASFATTR